MAVEYVKRKDVIEAICNLCRIENDDCSYPRCTIINTVKNIHAADVVERKRGKWERKLVPVCDDGIIMIPGNVCSECGGITTYNVSLFKYCPRCGAQMESGNK